VGSDALTETLLKVSITDNDPLGFSATIFTLKWVFVGSELWIDAPIAIRFPHAPGLRAVNAKPSVVLPGLKIVAVAAVAPGTLTPPESMPLPSVPAFSM
jgi:hypothetical protein